MQCCAVTKKGSQCAFAGRSIHLGQNYCGRHFHSIRINETVGTTTVTQALAMMPCSGITKRGRNCMKAGSRIFNGLSYCNCHLPNGFIDLTAEDVRPIVQYGNIPVDVEDDCPICFRQLKFETVVKTNCGHSFHQSCIDRWLENVQQCPMCRTSTHIKRGTTHRIEIIEYE